MCSPLGGDTPPPRGLRGIPGPRRRLAKSAHRRRVAAGANAAAEGLALAQELYTEAREKVAGVYVIPPFKQPEAALDVLE